VNQKVFHKKSLHKLKELVSQNAKNLFLVVDRISYESSGAKKFITQMVEDKIKVTIFDDFTANPKITDVEKGISLFRKGTYELILAIGGGSTLDMAKLISVLSHQDERIEDLITGKRKMKPVKTKLLAIPTTAGTGAEATKFAVLYVDKTKYSIEDPSLLPDFVYLSPLFTQSAGSYLIACTGLDAFCQAIESIWSVHSNSESELYACKAAQLVWHNLYDAFNSKNLTALENMQEAAYLAGKAINISKTTAPHALSYAFTSFYNIPHGHAVALSLPFFLNYNYHVNNNDCIDKRGIDSVKSRIGHILTIIGSPIEKASDTLIQFFNSMQIDIDLYTIIDNFNPSLISDNVNLERLSNNPRKITTAMIKNFLTGDHNLV